MHSRRRVQCVFNGHGFHGRVGHVLKFSGTDIAGTSFLRGNYVGRNACSVYATSAPEMSGCINSDQVRAH